MLRLSHVSVTLGGVEVLRNVSIHVPPNAFVALVGRNGAGKTTLMRSVMNLLPIASGEVYIGGKRTTRAQPQSHARSGVGYMPEDRRLVPAWSVEQNIMLPAWACHPREPRARLARIYELIPELVAVSDRKAVALSGGQQKLVALARAFMAGTRLLILDEPFEGVAPALAQRLVDILSDLRKEHTLSVLISESDTIHSSALVDRTVTIERGRIEDGATSDLAASS
jgi:branched-chain amino acid transport system ATP-binding protein